MVAGLLAVGTVGFRLTEHWSWFNCLYATLMTVSTIGAEPENQLSQSGKAFNVVLIFLGLGVIGYAIGMLTHGVIQSELGHFFGRRRMEREISSLHDHFIICGAGRVGRRIAAEVQARGLPLVIVDREAGRAHAAVTAAEPRDAAERAAKAVFTERVGLELLHHDRAPDVEPARPALRVARHAKQPRLAAIAKAAVERISSLAESQK